MDLGKTSFLEEIGNPAQLDLRSPQEKELGAGSVASGSCTIELRGGPCYSKVLPGDLLECRISGPTLDLLNQNLHL